VGEGESQCSAHAQVDFPAAGISEGHLDGYGRLSFGQGDVPRKDGESHGRDLWA